MRGVNFMQEFSENDWSKLSKEEKIHAEIERPIVTYWQDAWRRLKINKLAISGLLIIIILIIVATFGPLLSKYNYSDQNLEYISTPPYFKIIQLESGTNIYVHKALKIYEVSSKGYLIGAVKKIDEDMVNKNITYKLDGDIYILDYSQGKVEFKNSNNVVLVEEKTVFNDRYIFGSDDLGRDILTRVIYGARISLIIGIIASIVNLTLGVAYGGIAGYYGGKIDIVMMRIIEIMSSVPRMLYVIIFMVVLGSGLTPVILTIGLVYWLGMARIVRGQVLVLKESDYVLAAKALGADEKRIIFNHLIPNSMGPIIIVAAMKIPNAIFTEAFLSFIGLGVSAPQASWGSLCNDALANLKLYPYQLIFPALAISITVAAFNFLGDGLRDSLDPRLRK